MLFTFYGRGVSDAAIHYPIWTSGGGGGQNGPSLGFSPIAQKPFNQSSSNYVTLITII